MSQHHIIAKRAKLARDWRKLAKDFRDCAKQGLSPDANLRNAMHCEAKARGNEAWIRNIADQIISQGMRS